MTALLAGAAAVAAAPAPRWTALTEVGFQHLTQDQGLPNAIATALAEDGDGFLWVATLGGLARWDGYHFRVYKATPGSSGALPDNYVEALHGDGAGRLWVGTSGGGLARYDKLTDRFVTYPVGPKGLSHVSVYSIADDGAGGLWLGTGGGLDHLDPASGEIRRVLPEQFTRVHLVVQDRLGRVWVGTPGGLFMRAAGGSRFEPVPLPTANGMPAAPNALLHDSAGRVWVGTARDGAFLLPADGGPARAVVETAPLAGVPPLQLQPVGTLVEAQPGEIWLGTPGQGLIIVDAVSGATRRVRHRPALPLSLPDNVVRRLYRDRSGLVWVAGDRGASRHDPRQQAVLSAFGDAAAGVGSLGGEVSWILPLPDGRVWLGTHKNGVQILDPTRGVVAELRPDPARPETALPADQVLALEQGADGQVYIGTKRGLYRARADGSQLLRLALPGRDPTAATWALLAAGPLLWVGGQSDGLWRLDPARGTLQAMARGTAMLSDHRISVLAHAPGGSLWVGTRFGLNRFEPVSGQVQHIVPDPAHDDALPAGFVTTLHTDREQRLWVGTYGGGVSLLLREDGGRAHFRQVTTAQGLPDDNVNALLEDGDGAMWVSTDSGLARIDPRSLATRALRRAEGVVFPTYWTGSAGRTREGELLFGGAGGLSVVRPEQVQPWAWRPATVVTELMVGGRNVPAAAYLAPGAPPVTVEAAANSLAVEFTALDYSAPERNRYSYRLLGYDKGWIETDAKHRVASYTNLPPGRYTLQLRGSNRDGQWSEGPLSLPVRVLPAWHQTLWFRVAALLLALTALWGVVRQRTRYLRRQQAELERKVGERTAELERLSNVLQEKSRVLELSAISDPLTGLRNRRFLTQHIDGVVGASLRRAQQALNSGTAVQAADSDNVFLLIDIDHFKSVNDVHGHAAGDAVLVQFSHRLQQVMRDSDYLVRWGGEEFLAVARDTDRARAEDLAERIRAVIAETPFELEDGASLAVTCSVGFACLPFVPGTPRALGWQDVVKLADMALFAAKRVGRNAWVGLYATDSTDTAQLLPRMQAAPQQLVAADQLRVASDHTLAAVVEALQGH